MSSLPKYMAKECAMIGLTSTPCREIKNNPGKPLLLQGTTTMEILGLDEWEERTTVEKARPLKNRASAAMEIVGGFSTPPPRKIGGRIKEQNLRFTLTPLTLNYQHQHQHQRPSPSLFLSPGYRMVRSLRRHYCRDIGHLVQ